MIQRPPREPAWISVLIAVAWTVVIYVSIPLAMSIREVVAESVGRQYFTYAVLISLLAAVASALWLTLQSRPDERLSRIAWLAVIGLVFAGWTMHLRQGSPEEALHFVEYGVLGVLMFRAWTHGGLNWTVYIAAWLSGTLVGTIDEMIQWVVPDRYFDFRDILLNAAACGLALMAIAKGLRPLYLLDAVCAHSVRRVYLLGVLVWVLLFACLMNTKTARTRYEAAFPVVARLLRHADAMVQYGFLYEDPEIGRFKSRLSPERLAEEDRNRGVEAGAILDEYHDPERYREFLSIYTILSDPFLHEARVHLFRRDHRRHRSVRFRETDPERYREDVTDACRENRFMERYFPTTMSNTIFRLSREGVAWLERDQDADSPYVSGVSRRLITDWSQGQVALVMGGAWLAWSGICLYAVARVRRGLPSAPDGKQDPGE